MVNQSLLQWIVTQPYQTNYMSVDNFATRDKLRDQLVSKTCGGNFDFHPVNIILPSIATVTPSIPAFPTALEGCMADVALVVDNSGSIDGWRWRFVIDVLHAIVGLFNVGSRSTRIGLVDFGNQGYLVFDFTTYTTDKDVHAALDRLKYRGENSNMTGGMRLARERLFNTKFGMRSDAYRVMIVVSDGSPTYEADKLPEEVQHIKNMSIRIMAVGITEANANRLRSIVTQPHESNYFFSEAFLRVNFVDSERYKTMLDLGCKSVGRITAAPIMKDCKADVAFVVDNSGSIKDSERPGQIKPNWNLTIDFLKMLVTMLKVGPAGTRIGLVEFGNQGYFGFDFATYTTKEDVIAALGRLRFRGENTNTTGGMRLARERLFNPMYGMRPNVNHVMLLLTDGVPTYDADKLPEEVVRIKNMSIRIMAVGVSHQVNESLLRSIVTQPSESNYMFSENFTTLDKFMNEVLSGKLCNVPSAAIIEPSEDCKVADVAFVVDNSGSIRDSQLPGQDNWKLIVHFLTTLVPMLHVGPDRTRIGLVEFGNKGYFVFDFANFTTEKEVVNALETRLKFRGENTNTTGGMRLARERVFNPMYGMRPNVNHVMLLITDGVPTYDADKLQDEVDRIKNMSIRIMAVGVTHQVNETLLRSIVTQPNETNYVFAENFTTLGNIMNVVLSGKMCNNAVATIRPSNGASLSSHQPSMMLPSSSLTKVCIADVAFVVDNSGSIRDNEPPGQDNWALVVAFLNAVVQILDVGLDRTRIGLVEFGNEGYFQFDFTKFTTANDVIDELNKTLKFRGENTNTTGGMRLARERLFNTKYGMRPNVNHVIILVTDGVPTYDADTLGDEVDRIKNMSIRIITIGVTDKVNNTLLEWIATYPAKDNHFNVFNFSDLSSFNHSQVFANMCHTPSAAVATKTSTTTTSRTTTTAIGPRTWPTPADVKDRGANVIFLLDTSDHVEQRNFDTIKLFTRKVVVTMDLESGRVLVGVATFSDGVKEGIPLNKYTTRSSLVTAIDALRFSRGRRNTGDALKQVCERSFTVLRRDREQYPYFVVVVTNGASNSERNAVMAASSCKRSRIHIIVVAIGNWLNIFEINNMACWPHDRNVFFYRNFESLGSTRGTELNDLIFNTVNECSSNPCRNGGTCQDLIAAYVCLCTAGYAGQNCEQSCANRADVVFALDASGSCGPDNFQKQLDFLTDVAVGLNLQSSTNRMALVSFADEGVLQFGLDSFNNVVDGVAQPYPRGGTNMAAGLKLVREAMANQRRSGVNRIGVVLTDGQSRDLPATLRESSLVRADGISLLTVAIGNYTDRWELKDVASEPSSMNCLAVKDFDSLKTIQNNLLQVVCQNEPMCRNGRCLNGGQCIEQINGYLCQCPSGFTGINCERGCDGRLDICIVLDASGSIRSERFPEVLNFVVNVTDQFEVSSTKTRFAALKYSDDAVWLFDLDTYTSKQDVKVAIRRTAFMGGKTNSASAFSMMTSRIFKSSGDRPDVPNVALFLWDGKSNVHPELSTPAAISARNQGIHVIAFGVGTDVDSFEMLNIASEPKNENVFIVSSQKNLSSILNRVVMATCDNFDSCASNPCQNGGTCRRHIKRFECECRPFYSGDRCEQYCKEKLDIVFALDVSGSIESYYDEMVNFTRRTIHRFPIGSDATRISIITFSENATILFNLSTYLTTSSIRNALVFKRTEGETSIHQAIALARQSAFSVQRGNRPDVRDVLIMVTDGHSTVKPDNIRAEVVAAAKSIDILVIGIGKEADVSGIGTIGLMYVRNANDVTPVSIQVANLLCHV